MSIFSKILLISVLLLKSNEVIFSDFFFPNKPFNKDEHDKYLKHENIENLKGLEIELVYKWNLGDLLIFDRTNLHCSSSNIKNKKIGLTTFTKK